MDIKPIKNQEQYHLALERIEAIFDAKKGSTAGDELEVLAILVEKYESEHFPIEAPDPIEAIKFRMEQMGYIAKDLEAIIGTRARVSEILAKKRKLTLSMIRRINKHLDIPTDILVQAY